MRARDIMSLKIMTVSPEATVAEIVEILIEQGVSAVPVVDKGQLVGMVSEGDLLRRRELGTQKRRRGWRAFLVDADTLAREYVVSHATCAGDIMSKPVITAAPDTPVAEIADLMEEHRIKRVPVVDNGKLAGMVTRADLVRALTWRQLEQHAQTDDGSIRNTLQQRLRGQRWADSATVGFAVDNGIITLSGFVSSDEQATALRIMAASIPGVSQVNAKLDVRPYSAAGLAVSP